MTATKEARLDLRLTRDQRSVIERAAQLSGSTMTGWAVSTLSSIARREVATQATTCIPAAEWEAFLHLLEGPVAPEMTELINRTPVWDQG